MKADDPKEKKHPNHPGLHDIFILISFVVSQDDSHPCPELKSVMLGVFLRT